MIILSTLATKTLMSLVSNIAETYRLYSKTRVGDQKQKIETEKNFCPWWHWNHLCRQYLRYARENVQSANVEQGQNEKWVIFVCELV